MAIVYTDDPKNIDFNKVTDFINSSATGKNAEFNKVIKAFLNSTYSVYALDGEEIVGVGRALSDDIEWTLITGLTVSEERRDEITGNILGSFWKDLRVMRSLLILTALIINTSKIVVFSDPRIPSPFQDMRKVRI